MGLLGSLGEDALHLALEAMAAVVGAAPTAAVAMEPMLAPIILRIWGDHANDPLLAISCQDALAALAASPEALPGLLVCCPMPVAIWQPWTCFPWQATPLTCS